MTPTPVPGPTHALLLTGRVGVVQASAAELEVGANRDHEIGSRIRTQARSHGA